MPADRMKELETWDVEAIEAGIRGLAESEIGAGKVIHLPLGDLRED